MRPAEYFTYQFYTWESRGRGWLCFDEPVCLEPPFIPFIRQFPRSGYIDESKRPTWVSSLIDQIKGKKQATHQDEELLDYVTIEPFEYRNTLDFSCHIVRIPKARKPHPEIMRAFLIMLSQTSFNISFELFGNRTEIILQFVSCSEESLILKTYLNSYFPECTIQSDNHYVEILPADKQTHTVDFGLQEECVRPLALSKNFVIDPLTSIFGILDSLKGEEFAGIQVLFQGAVNNWSQSMMRAVSAGDGKSFFADTPEAPKIAQEKLGSPLFGVSIRAFSQEKGSSSIIQNLTHAIIQATKGPYNQLMAMHSDIYANQDRISDIYLRESHRLGMLLSADELVSLIHFPTESIQSKKLHPKTRKTVAVPEIAKNKKTILGSNTYERETTEVTYGIEDRLKHTHIIGATGTGKSTLLAHMMLQDIEAGFGIALFDPHGDLVDDVLARIPKEAIERVVIIDPSDSEFPVGLNIVEAHSDLEKEVLSSDLVASFKRLSTSWGDQMNTVFANAILALLESPEGGTLNDLRRFLIEAPYRNAYLKNVQDPSIRYYWQKEYPLLKTNSIGPILTRLDTFLRPRIIRNMVSQKQGLDFEKILSENKILMVKLPQGLIGRENSYLLGSLILSKLHQASFGRQASLYRPPFFIYLDEFHNFITPSIKELLSGVRKYHVGLILSHQDLQQIQREDTELLNSVLGNTYTRIVFRVGEPDAKKLQDGFTDFDFTDMQNLGIGEALIRIEQPRYNTTFDTKPLERIDPHGAHENIHRATELSRMHYAQPKEQIEKVLFESFIEVVDLTERTTKTSKPTSRPENVEESIQEETVEKTTEASDVVETNEPEISVEKTSTETTVSLLRETEIEREEAVDSTHTYLKQLVKRIAENKQYKVTIEYGIPNGSIDVVCERGSERLAIEISVTTDPVWEVHNLGKCIGLGFTHIISLCGDKKQLSKIEKKCKELIPEYMNHNMYFFTPDQLYSELAESSEPEGETAIVQKGYRVSVSYSDDGLPANNLTQKNITQTIIHAMRKKGNKK